MGRNGKLSMAMEMEMEIEGSRQSQTKYIPYPPTVPRSPCSLWMIFWRSRFEIKCYLDLQPPHSFHFFFFLYILFQFYFPYFFFFSFGTRLGRQKIKWNSNEIECRNSSSRIFRRGGRQKKKKSCRRGDYHTKVTENGQNADWQRGIAGSGGVAGSLVGEGQWNSLADWSQRTNA